VAVDERELILELFPGTPFDLLPPGEVLYYREGERVVRYVLFCEDTEACRERARPEVLRRILRKGILP